MNPKRHHRAALLSLCTALFTSTAGAQVVGDLCDDPILQDGTGNVLIDMSVMALPSGDWVDDACFPSNPSHQIDAYICWTSDVDGLVEISTCGLTGMNTQLALFDDCVCPNLEMSPLCCSDNSCDKQTLIRCDVVCGRQYTVLVSATDLAGGPNLEVSFQPLGDPCPIVGEHELISCEDCCGAMPEVTGFAGLQALASQWRIPSDVDDPFVLHVFDLDPAGLSAPGTTSAPPTYEHPDWTLENLGSVFGVAMSGDGTMYASATRIYNIDYTGLIGDTGTIFRLDGVTGAPTEFVSLPNTSLAGLGNIAASCSTGLLYASNFDDGLIWAVDDSGTPVDSYRHADGSITGTGGNPDDQAGYAPLGERPWAVQPVGDRLYYSVWVEDAGRVDVNRNNEVWSVGIDASTGLFIAGTRQMEFSTPDLVYTVDENWPEFVANPIADITQGPDCCLYLAERSMSSDGSTSAHRSRVLVACQQEDGSWTIDEDLYDIGVYDLGANASGGVAVDFSDDGRVWATADAVTLSGTEITYGIQGTPITGGTPAESIKIDLDNNIKEFDKTGIGSIDITCMLGDTGPCAAAATYDTIECVVDDAGPTGEYIVHVELENLSDHDVQYLLVPSGQVSPSMVPFNPPLLAGGSTTIDFTVTGAPLEIVCIPMILFDIDGDQCCTVELCVELPECTCATLAGVEIGCTSDGAGNIVLNFDLTNLTPDVIEHLFFLPLVGSGDIITPDYLDIPPLAPYSTMSIGPITVSTTVPVGDPHSIYVSLHSATLKECCAMELPFIVPDCGEGSTLGDLNGDGLINGADLAILLGAWGSEGPGDLDGNGQVDGADLALLLGVWSP